MLKLGSQVTACAELSLREDQPAIWVNVFVTELKLMAFACELDPPKEPRSFLIPLIRRNASAVEWVWACPTIWPASLIAWAELTLPPKVPRSLMPVFCFHKNA